MPQEWQQAPEASPPQPQAGGQSARSKRKQAKKDLAGRSYTDQMEALGSSAPLGPDQAQAALAYDRAQQPRLGSSYVAALQEQVHVPPTGAFDEETVQAVAGYQQDKNLKKVDGKVGPETRRSLKSTLPEPQAAGVTGPGRQGGPAAAAAAAARGGQTGAAAGAAALHQAPALDEAPRPAPPGPEEACGAAGDEVSAGAAGYTEEDAARVLGALAGMSRPQPAAGDNNAVDITPLVTWLEQSNGLLARAKEVHAGLADGILKDQFAQLIDEKAGLAAQWLEAASSTLKSRVIQLTNESSVLNKTAAAPRLPGRGEVNSLMAKLRTTERLDEKVGLPGIAPNLAVLKAAAQGSQDAALATLQALAVLGARETWAKGDVKEPKGAAAVAKAKKDPDDPLNKIFKDSAFSTVMQSNSDGTAIADWCGIFVGAHLFRSSGIDEELRSGYYHVKNILDIFQYKQASNADRSPRSIFADGQWWDLKAYHGARGSLRKWTTRDQVAAALLKDQPLDIRPGDVVLIDHSGGNDPGHITMVESYDASTRMLTTIEGNTRGIRPDSKGQAETVGEDGEAFKQQTQAYDTVAVHQRDLTTTSKETRKKFAGGTPAAASPKGAYHAREGYTLFGVGRPSIVDFEEHEYAARAIPEKLRQLSPQEMMAIQKNPHAVKKPQ